MRMRSVLITTKMLSRRILKNVICKQSLQQVRKVAAVNTAVKHKMQAWQIHSYGDVNELQLTAARIPYIANPSDMLIKVNAASVNPIDTSMMRGYGKEIMGLLRCYELEFPLTLGRDFAGVIVDKGYDVTNKFKIGDNVYGIIPTQKQGSHAEFVIANESHVLPQPSHLKPVEATSMLYTALTAWSALYLTGGLILRDPRRTKILILGASGGVGTVALQMLKSQNAMVIGTCSSDAMPLVTSLGADNVFDYGSPDYIESVALEGKYDIILDCAQFGHQNIPQTWKYNKYITLNSPLLINTDKYGLVGGLALSIGDLFNANVFKCLEGKSVRWGFFLPSNDGLRFVDKLIKNNHIQPTIHKIFKFDEVPQAYEALTSGHLRGKIVIDMQNS